jgi:WXXGXW repeat (2 copies)
MKTQLVLAAALAAGLLMPGCASESGRAVVVRPNGEIVVPQAPPTGRTQVVPPAPSAADVWVPGFWSYNDNHWAWVPGQWKAPRREGAVWVNGHWHRVTGGWVWTPGHWE